MTWPLTDECSGTHGSPENERCAARAAGRAGVLQETDGSRGSLGPAFIGVSLKGRSEAWGAGLGWPV